MARVLVLLLVALLAVPGTAVTYPTGSLIDAPAAVDAKKKDKKPKKNKPRYTTVTHTVRQSVTQTFSNGASITIPGTPGQTMGKANPYPTKFTVNAFTNGIVTDVNLILTDFTHTAPSDVDILMLHHTPSNENCQPCGAVVLSDAGGGTDVNDIDLTLDDEAAAALPVGALSSGVFRPANHDGVNTDDFPDSGVDPTSNSALTEFDGVLANGIWYLWIMDDAASDVGDIASWSLQITADADVQIQERVRIPDKKKKKGKGRR